MKERYNKWKMQGATGNYSLTSEGVISGFAQTPLGIVTIDACRTHEPFGFVSFRIIYKGYVHTLYRDGNFTKRGLVTMAHRFAKKVVNG